MNIAEQYRDSRLQGILLAAVDLASSGQSHQTIERFLRVELGKVDAEVAVMSPAFAIVQSAHLEVLGNRGSCGERGTAD